MSRHTAAPSLSTSAYLQARFILQAHTRHTVPMRLCKRLHFCTRFVDLCAQRLAALVECGVASGFCVARLRLGLCHALLRGRLARRRECRL